MTAEVVVSTFDYTLLPADKREQVRDGAAFILDREASIHQEMIQIGMKLLEIYEEIPHGLKGAWVKSEFGWSVDTAENYMNVARNYGEIASPESYDARALYLLARDKIPQDIRDEAARLVASGQRITYEVAFVLARSPIAVRERFSRGEIGANQAYGLTRALIDATPTVRDFAVAQKVSSGEVVRYLTQAHVDWEKTKEMERPRTTWQDILHDQGNLVIRDEVVPLAKANERDLEQYIAWRRYCHIEAGRAKKAAQFETFTGALTITPQIAAALRLPVRMLGSTVEYTATRQRSAEEVGNV